MKGGGATSPHAPLLGKPVDEARLVEYFNAIYYAFLSTKVAHGHGHAINNLLTCIMVIVLQNITGTHRQSQQLTVP